VKRHDVVIVGGGPAGLAAAATLRERGIGDVVVLERAARAGGVPRHCGHLGFGLGALKLMTGPRYAADLVARAGDAVRTQVTVTALHPGGVLDIVDADGPRRIAGKCVLLATGARETPRSARLVPGTRPWGVLTTGALQELVHAGNPSGVRRIVVIGTELVAFSILLTARHAGIEVVAMVEADARISARRPGDAIARFLFGVPVLVRTRAVAIHGAARVTGVEVESDGAQRVLACDAVIFTGMFRPESALLAGGAIETDPATRGPAIDQHWRCSDPAYFAAGNLLRGIETAGVAAAEGRAAAWAIAAALRDELPLGVRRRITTRGPIAYVYPQLLTFPGWPVDKLLLRARVARRFRGALALTVDGHEAWRSAARLYLPHRRIDLPRHVIPTDAAAALELVAHER
jgi:NADPH-dependent 2,4-dienoyl-CoA reductase/sulfur reductase-like enzyme